MTNTSDKTLQVSMLLRIAAGLFVLSAIMDTVDYYNYTSFALSLVAFISNIVSIVFLAIVMFKMKGVADSGTSTGRSKFNQAGGGLITYAILWPIYNFTPSIGIFGDLVFFIVVLIARGIAFYLINSAFKSLYRGMENWIYPMYGFNQLVFFALIFVFVFMGVGSLASIVSTISYWVDTLLMVGVAIVLFLGSNKVTSAPKAVPSIAQPYTPTTYSTYQTPTILTPVETPAKSKPKFCTSCGATIEADETFCTNCGAKIA